MTIANNAALPVAKRQRTIYCSSRGASVSCSVLFTRGWADLRGSGRYALSFPLSSPMYSTSHTLAPRHPAYYLNFNPSCCRQRNDGRNVLARDISGGISSHVVAGYLYPAVGFGFWHLAPLSIVPSTMSGGSLYFAIFAVVLGLAFGWVALSTGSIRWTTVSHALLDFAGLGTLIYFTWGRFQLMQKLPRR